MNIRRARLGFTLIELVLVLAIISVIAGMALPRYASASARYRVKAAAHRVAADLKLARATARARSSAAVVSFTGTNPAYYDIPVLKNADGSGYRATLSADPYRVLLKANFGGSSDLNITGFGTSASGEVELSSGALVCKVTLEGGSGLVTITGP